MGRIDWQDLQAHAHRELIEFACECLRSRAHGWPASCTLHTMSLAMHTHDRHSCCPQLISDTGRCCVTSQGRSSSTRAGQCAAGHSPGLRRRAYSPLGLADAAALRPRPIQKQTNRRSSRPSFSMVPRTRLWGRSRWRAWPIWALLLLLPQSCSTSLPPWAPLVRVLPCQLSS